MPVKAGSYTGRMLNQATLTLDLARLTEVSSVVAIDNG